MKILALAVTIAPAVLSAQDFGPLPTFTANGITANTSEVHACVAEQVVLGPSALVTAAARDCIGREAQLCMAAPETCAALEQSYWDWRIAKTYEGLQAWVADSGTSDQVLRQSVTNPATATANVPLECQLRLDRQSEGAINPVALAQCKMRETALVALELEFTVRQACTDEQGTGAFAVFCARQGD